MSYAGKCPVCEEPYPSADVVKCPSCDAFLMRPDKPEAMTLGQREVTERARQALLEDAGTVNAIDAARGYLIRNVLEPNGAKPLPTLMGVCTQVDHITAGLRQRIARLEGEPRQCESCNSDCPEPYEWAWGFLGKWLCKPCGEEHRRAEVL